MITTILDGVVYDLPSDQGNKLVRVIGDEEDRVVLQDVGGPLGNEFRMPLLEFMEQASEAGPDKDYEVHGGDGQVVRNASPIQFLPDSPPEPAPAFQPVESKPASAANDLVQAMLNRLRTSEPVQMSLQLELTTLPLQSLVQALQLLGYDAQAINEELSKDQQLVSDLGTAALAAFLAKQ